MSEAASSVVALPTAKTLPILQLLAYAAALTLALLPFLIYPVPALTDYLNHLARMHVLASIDHSPELQQNYAVAWRITPYLLMDVMVPALAKVMPLEVAGKLFVVLAMAGMFLGVCALRLVLFGRVGWWPLLAIPVIYGGPLAWGFVNFVFAAGEMLLILALWLYLRDRAGWRTMAAFNLLTACLFLTHLFGLCAYALTVAIVAWEAVLRDQGASLAERAHRLAFEAAQFVLPVMLWGLSYSGTGTSFQPLSLPTLGGKLFEVVSTLSFTGTFIDLAAFAVFCALMFLGWRRLRLAPPMVAPILGMTALFPLLPTWLDGAVLMGMRLPLIVLLLVFGSIQVALSRRAAFCLAATVSLLFAVKIGIVLHQWRDYQDVLAETEVTLENLPRGAALLPVQSLGKDSPRGALDLPIQRYWHLCAAAVLERDAYIPYLFSGATVIGPHPARRKTSVVADTPVSPDALRQSAQFGHADLEQNGAYWRDWPRDFEYVLWVHGTESIDIRGLPLEPVARGRAVDLYRIIPPPS